MPEPAPKPAKPPTRPSPPPVPIPDELRRLAYEAGVLRRALNGRSNVLAAGLEEVNTKLDEILALLRR